MKIYKNKFKDMLIIKAKKFEDERGYFRELILEKYIKKKLIFTVVSKSKKNVLRGIHMQKKKMQGKYISVIKGKILDVAIDCRKKSQTFGKYFKIILSDKNATSLYIPPGFAHGFLAMGKENIVVYSCTNYRDANSEISIYWNDKNLNINWPIKKPLISKKDSLALSFNKFFI